MAKVMLSQFEGDSDWPLSYLVDSGIIELVRVGRWPFRRYGLRITDRSTFEGAVIDADRDGVRLTVPAHIGPSSEGPDSNPQGQ